MPTASVPTIHASYEAVAPLTFSTTWFAVSLDEARAIIAINQVRRQIRWLQRNIPCHAPDYPQGESADPWRILSAARADTLRTLMTRIDGHLAGFPAGAFVRLSTRSPKDAPLFCSANMRERMAVELRRVSADLSHRAVSDGEDADRHWRQNVALISAHRAFTGLLCVRSGREAVELFAASQRVCMDLERSQMVQEGGGFECQCVVRAWDGRVRPEMEVRAFVSEGRLCAATQYHKGIFVPQLHAARIEVERLLVEMHGKLDAALPQLRSFCFDCAFVPMPQDSSDGLGADSDGVGLQLLLIEINHPPPLAGTALFDWADERDRLLLEGRSEGRDFELRLLSELPRRDMASARQELEAFGQAVVGAADEFLGKTGTGQRICTVQ